MMPDDARILTVAEMVAAEEALIVAGTSVDALMQRAGAGAAQWIWRLSGGRAVTVLCGPGNNGGDGYVIAEYIRDKGCDVVVVATAEPATDAARTARGLYHGAVVANADGRRAEVFVDCLFGSGLSRPLDDAMTGLLGDLTASHALSVAVDIPSGLDSDSGQPLNSGLPHYDLTLALGAWKYAHWLMPGAAMMGQRRMVPIGVAGRIGSAAVMASPRIHAPLPDAHKYTRGLAGVVGGVMPGAALLACKSAMGGGAGYVKLFAPNAPVGLAADLVADTGPLAKALSDPRMAAVLVGPGLGRDEGAKARLLDTLAQGCAAVLDADALNLLEPAMLAGRMAPVIATPHEGELKSLCARFGVPFTGKLPSARALARASGMVVVAKGPDTIITLPDGRAVLAPLGPSWLSVAGSGDVLAGLVLSRLAVVRDPVAAATEAVWLHGLAAKLAGPAFTADGLAERIPEALGACL